PDGKYEIVSAISSDKFTPDKKYLASRYDELDLVVTDSGEGLVFYIPSRVNVDIVDQQAI
ncbi:MAG: hypothetical protein LC687_06825, partial [Actinobacteria bacterium]|nr:hypothetical protein [Actinomycetota bacterium]